MDLKTGCRQESRVKILFPSERRNWLAFRWTWQAQARPTFWRIGRISDATFKLYGLHTEIVHRRIRLQIIFFVLLLFGSLTSPYKLRSFYASVRYWFWNDAITHNTTNYVPVCKVFRVGTVQWVRCFNLSKTQRNLRYIRNQSVPRSKHFPPQL